MESDVFGKLCTRVGWVVNYEIMPFFLVLLGGNIRLLSCWVWEHVIVDILNEFILYYDDAMWVVCWYALLCGMWHG